MLHHEIARFLQHALGASVAVRAARFEQTIDHTASGVAPKRHRELVVGRALARDLLSELGVIADEIGTRADRSPDWPSGIIGSISHTDDVCAVAVSREHSMQAIGIDVEVSTAVTSDLLPLVTSARERRSIRMLDSRFATLIFSAKETFYKAQAPKTGRFLEFADVEIELDLAARMFTATVLLDDHPLHGRAVVGSFEVNDRFVCTAIGW